MKRSLENPIDKQSFSGILIFYGIGPSLAAVAATGTAVRRLGRPRVRRAAQVAAALKGVGPLGVTHRDTSLAHLQK